MTYKEALKRAAEPLAALRLDNSIDKAMETIDGIIQMYSDFRKFSENRGEKVDLEPGIVYLCDLKEGKTTEDKNFVFATTIGRTKEFIELSASRGIVSAERKVGSIGVVSTPTGKFDDSYYRDLFMDRKQDKKESKITLDDLESIRKDIKLSQNIFFSGGQALKPENMEQTRQMRKRLGYPDYPDR